MTQKFTTTDVLRLEIETEPDGLVNLVVNPSGELGTYGWITPVAGSHLEADAAPNLALWYSTPEGAAQPNHFYTEQFPITGGHYVAAAWKVRQSETWEPEGAFHAQSIEFLNSSGTVIGQSPTVFGTDRDPELHISAPSQAPAGAAFARFRIDLYQNAAKDDPDAGVAMSLSEVTVAQAATSSALGTERTNHVPNPSFEVNTTGWAGTTGVVLSRSTAQAHTGSACLALSGSPAGGLAVAHTSTGTAGIPVDGSTTYVASAYMRRGAGFGRSFALRVDFYDAAGDLVNSSPLSNTVTPGSAGWERVTHTVTPPTTAAFASVQIRCQTAMSTSDVFYLDAVMLERSNTAGTYFDGSTANTTTLSYSWTGTAHASASLEASSRLDTIEPIPFLNILGPTHDLKVTREALNIGTLSATILDSTLDPAASETIRPGRRVRLRALDNDRGEWETLFTGKASHASVSYHLKDPNVPDSKRARIELTAVDNTAALSNSNRAEGVATLAELPHVLEGCGVPWNVEGSGYQVPDPTVVSINENASALDQIAITRDTNLAYAWVDRFGVLQVWGPTTISRVARPLLDDSVVTDYDVSYNTDDCINEVMIRFLRLNPTTGETEEIPYGPYRNETSIAEWGVRSAEFTIHGEAEEVADIEEYASVILTANAEPVVRVNAVTVAVDEAWIVSRDRALAEVMDFAQIDKDSISPVFYENSYITAIEHTITSGKWLVRFVLSSVDVVASPQFTPSPSTGAGGKTIGQLLRPIGEVTMFYGTKAEIPAGWLALDGSMVPAQYTDLIDLIGSTLPDFTDRFPIGAGTKALGTTGGSPTKTLTVAQMPEHTHPMDHGHAGLKNNTSGSSNTTWQAGANNSNNVNTGSGNPVQDYTGNTGTRGNGNPFDVMNPWRALWFIIRAV